MSRREALGGDLVIERKPGFARVWHARSARDLTEAFEVLAAMDDALRDWDIDRLLFDSRDADNTPPDVARAIWTWLSQHPTLARVATLVHSQEMADSINLGGIRDDVRIRAFHLEKAAIRWLTILR